jgi:hypothetical protein
MTTRQLKALDKQIEQIFYATSSGVQIPILSIGKIFAAGRAAAVAGTSIEAAVVTSVAALRVN